MAETIDLSTLDPLSVVESEDLILGYSKSGKKFGFVPVSVVTNGGYACRRWNINNSSPVGEAVGNIDYLRELPSMLGLGCYLVDKNHGRRKLDPANHYKFATGETAKLDGSMGDYMWGWGTKWYYAFWVEGNYWYEAASLKPIPGRQNYIIPVASMSALGVSVVDRDNLELVSVINETARYRGGNNDTAKDGQYNTLLGRAATSLNAETFGSYARKKGQGWEAYWYAHNAAMGALFRIIFGTRNIQASYNANKDSNGLYQGGLGSGVTGVGTWWSGTQYNYYPFLPTSVGVELADGCGVSGERIGRNNCVDCPGPCILWLEEYVWLYGPLGKRQVDQQDCRRCRGNICCAETIFNLQHELGFRIEEGSDSTSCAGGRHLGVCKTDEYAESMSCANCYGCYIQHILL